MKYSLIALNETEYFTDEIKSKVSKIYTVYAYNPEEEVYCCEITPSYFCIPIDFTIPFSDELYDSLSDEQKEALNDVLEESVNVSDGIYVHVRDVERIDSKYKFESKNDFQDEEEALDYYRSNKML